MTQAQMRPYINHRDSPNPYMQVTTSSVCQEVSTSEGLCRQETCQLQGASHTLQGSAYRRAPRFEVICSESLTPATHLVPAAMGISTDQAPEAQR